MTDTSDLIQQAQLLANDQRDHGSIIIADTLQQCVSALSDLEAQLRLMEKRAEDAESRNDFLITELDNLIEKARQS